MSPNNTNYPGDDSDHGNVPPQPRGSDPLAGNPYSTQYRQASAPDLDAGAPELRSNDLRRMNRRALGFLAAIVALLVVLAVFVLKNAGSHQDAPKQREETVSVPEAPKPIFQARTVPPLPQPLPQPIPLAPPTPPAEPGSMKSQQQANQGPTLVQRRIEADEAGGSAGASNNQAQQASTLLPTDPDASSDVPTRAQPLSDPNALMARGTYIRCLLETRLISDFPGYSTCVVTDSVYSFNGHKLLLPKGSRVLGKYDAGPSGPNGTRIAVIWDRIVTPNGINVNMSNRPAEGMDSLGGAGLPGHVNSHWFSRISSALLVSMLSDAFLYEGEKHGPKTTNISDGGVVTESPYQSNTAATLQQLAGQAVQKSANRPTTLTINQGTVITIYVAKDVDFSGVVSRF